MSAIWWNSLSNIMIPKRRTWPSVKSSSQQLHSIRCAKCHLRYKSSFCVNLHNYLHERASLAKKKLICNLCGRNFAKLSNFLVHKTLHKTTTLRINSDILKCPLLKIKSGDISEPSKGRKIKHRRKSNPRKIEARANNDLLENGLEGNVTGITRNYIQLINSDGSETIHQVSNDNKGILNEDENSRRLFSSNSFRELEEYDCQTQLNNVEIVEDLHQELREDIGGGDNSLHQNYSDQTLVHFPRGKKNCSVCGKYFTKRWSLQRHYRAHFDARPFRCSICGGYFKELGHLNQHLVTHRQSKPFQCDMCFATFTRNESLRNHKRRIHHMITSGSQSPTSLDGIFKNTYDRETEPATKLGAEFHQGQLIAGYRKATCSEMLDFQDNSFLSADGLNKRLACRLCQLEMHSDEEIADHMRNEHAHDVKPAKRGPMYFAREENFPNENQPNLRFELANQNQRFCNLCGAWFSNETDFIEHAKHCEEHENRRSKKVNDFLEYSTDSTNLESPEKSLIFQQGESMAAPSHTLRNKSKTTIFTPNGHADNNRDTHTRLKPDIAIKGLPLSREIMCPDTNNNCPVTCDLVLNNTSTKSGRDLLKKTRRSSNENHYSGHAGSLKEIPCEQITGKSSLNFIPSRGESTASFQPSSQSIKASFRAQWSPNCVIRGRRSPQLKPRKFTKSGLISNVVEAGNGDRISKTPPIEKRTLPNKFSCMPNQFDYNGNIVMKSGQFADEIFNRNVSTNTATISNSYKTFSSATTSGNIFQPSFDKGKTDAEASQIPKFSDLNSLKFQHVMPNAISEVSRLKSFRNDTTVPTLSLKQLRSSASRSPGLISPNGSVEVVVTNWTVEHSDSGSKTCFLGNKQLAGMIDDPEFGTKYLSKSSLIPKCETNDVCNEPLQDSGSIGPFKDHVSGLMVVDNEAVKNEMEASTETDTEVNEIYYCSICETNQAKRMHICRSKPTDKLSKRRDARIARNTQKTVDTFYPRWKYELLENEGKILNVEQQYPSPKEDVSRTKSTESDNTVNNEIPLGVNMPSSTHINIDSNNNLTTTTTFDETDHVSFDSAVHLCAYCKKFQPVTHICRRTETYPFKCPKCDKKFKHRHFYDKHAKQKHNEFHL